MRDEAFALQLLSMAERWELWLRDKKLCEWDIAPPPEVARFDLL